MTLPTPLSFTDVHFRQPLFPIRGVRAATIGSSTIRPSRDRLVSRVSPDLKLEQSAILVSEPLGAPEMTMTRVCTATVGMPRTEVLFLEPAVR